MHAALVFCYSADRWRSQTEVSGVYLLLEAAHICAASPPPPLMHTRTHVRTQAFDEQLEAAKLSFLAEHLLQTAAPLATDFVCTQSQPLSDELLTVIQVGGEGVSCVHDISQCLAFPQKIQC